MALRKVEFINISTRIRVQFEHFGDDAPAWNYWGQPFFGH
jgi:hypothetical protein